MMNTDWQQVEQEAIEHLRALVRINTTNPPGNETAAAQYLAAVLQREGLAPEIVESAPGRGSVFARLPGTDGKKPLLLLSHLDVVPAEASAWQRDPFGGDLVDGMIWGRGAVDTKQLTVQGLMTLLLLKRQGAPLKRGIIFAATADEEMGGGMGVRWLAEHRPDLFECDFGINEGGGFGVSMKGRTVYLVQTAEKGVCWTKIRARGRPGHASVPKGENAVVALAEVIRRVARARLPQHNTATVEAMLQSLGGAFGFPTSWVLRLLLVPWLSPLLLRLMPADGMMRPLLNAVLHNTATPTVLRAGDKTNVIPSLAEAQIDCRVLPGQSFESVTAELRPYLGDKIEIEPLIAGSGCEVDYNTELFRLFGQVLADEDPGSVVAPFMVPGGTDGRYLVALGKRVYGFSPMKQEPGLNPLELAHGHNERISVRNLMFGAKVLYEVVRRFCQ